MRLHAELLELRTRHEFRIAHGAHRHYRNVLVRLEHDGITGLGEGSASHYYGESYESMRAALDAWAPLLGDDPFALEAIGARLDSALMGNGSARAALEMALHDWIGKKLGLPVWQLLGLDAAAAPVSVDGVATDALGRMLLPALAALVGITAGTLYQKRFCPRFDLRTGSVLQFLPSLALTALVASQVETMQIDWSGEFVFALLWLVLVLSLGAISLLNLLIRSGSAVNVASLFYLTPPTTALIAWAMFGETLSPLALAGMAIAVSGVWLARKG